MVQPQTVNWLYCPLLFLENDDRCNLIKRLAELIVASYSLKPCHYSAGVSLTKLLISPATHQLLNFAPNSSQRLPPIRANF